MTPVHQQSKEIFSSVYDIGYSCMGMLLCICMQLMVSVYAVCLLFSTQIGKRQTDNLECIQNIDRHLFLPRFTRIGLGFTEEQIVLIINNCFIFIEFRVKFLEILYILALLTYTIDL